MNGLLSNGLAALSTSGNRIISALSGDTVILRGVNRSGLEYCGPDEQGFLSGASISKAEIEFIVKDMPEHQIPMRGGLRWLDIQCLTRHDKAFKDCSQQQQMEIVDEIAWPAKAKPEMSQGVAFFSLMRNLVASGFYTTEIGVKDIGYMGNVPNQWNGVPADVLQQYGLAYSEKELKECVSFDKA